MRAIGYFRESPERASTLAQQNKAFLEFCARNGYEPGVTFADTQAANSHAPGFGELISFLRQRGEPCVVVVSSIDTLGDALPEAVRRCYQIQGLGARLAPIDGSDDLAADVVAAWTRQDGGSTISERVRQAMRRKAVRGEVLGRPPYGYKVGSRRRLELVPEEAVVVRYIFRLYLQEGLGIRLIARRLNNEGLRTRRGGNWSMVSIRDILRNRAYLGTYARFGVRVPGSHPALVSAEDFRAVQDRLNARRTSASARTTTRFLLSGIAFCGSCGNKLIGVSRRQAWTRKGGERVQNSYRYYQCESRTNQSICDYHTRKADDLERDVRDAIGDAAEAPATALDRTRAAAEWQRECERLRSRLRSIDRRIERYLESAARGRATKERMHQQTLRAAADRLAVEDALTAAADRLTLAEASETGERRTQLLQRLAQAWDAMPFAERYAALRECISRITVRDSGIEVALRP
jgi:DNA invertase Pin-like site-specific DNA recombinase